MSSPRQATGRRGEQIAQSYLQSRGYHLIDHNFFVRGGEVDLIAERPDGAIAFIEVKYRTSTRYGMPYEAVTRAKLRRLSKSIQLYLLKNNLQARRLRLEVVSIVQTSTTTPPQIRHFDDLEVPI